MTAEATGKGHGDKDERQRELLIAALLSQPTYEKAARVCGLSKATVCRRMQDEDFRAAFRTAQRELLEVTIAHLHQAGTQAVRTLVKALSCRSPSVRVSAARALLEFQMRGKELLEMEDRLAALEERLSEEGGTA